jgi:hypothetical protein
VKVKVRVTQDPGIPNRVDSTGSGSQVRIE